MRLRFVALIFILLFIGNLYGEEDSSYEKFLFVSVDTGYTIKGLLDGGIGVGGQVEFANLRYLGISANVGYVTSSGYNTNFNMMAFGGALLFYPEGYGPYGYYIKVGCMYNSAERISDGNRESGTLITIPMQLGMKFVFDDLWGLTFDPYLEGEIYIGLGGIYPQAVTVKQSVGFRFGFTF